MQFFCVKLFYFDCFSLVYIAKAFFLEKNVSLIDDRCLKEESLNKQVDVIPGFQYTKSLSQGRIEVSRGGGRGGGKLVRTINHAPPPPQSGVSV